MNRLPGQTIHLKYQDLFSMKKIEISFAAIVIGTLRIILSRSLHFIHGCTLLSTCRNKLFYITIYFSPNDSWVPEKEDDYFIYTKCMDSYPKQTA